MTTTLPPRLPDDALLRDGPDGSWLLFRAPRRRLVARRLEDVRPRLAEAARLVDREGQWAVGWIAYEAGPAFDPALSAHPPGESTAALPLLHLTLYPEPQRLDRPPEPDHRKADRPYRTGDWRPTVCRREFDRSLATIQEALAAGDSYQANYTFRLRTDFAGDPYAFFLDLARGQQAGHAAFLGDGCRVVASASPELFFRLAGDRLTCRPMKGTARRGRTTDEDDEHARALAASAKERAENVMIVDMIRNDLGRIARPGSVRPEALFTVERYPTVLQMTSTVTAESGASVEEIFAALFPCASITGAPKIRTTRLLRELEPDPRGLYTGALGYLAPGRRSCWNVAIRTAVIDLPAEGRPARVEYGVGGGIVADSTADAEWEETRDKARVLSPPPPAFELLETLRWEPARPGLQGYRLLPEHLARLQDSARYFGFRVDPKAVEQALESQANRLPTRPHKIRMTVAPEGELGWEAEPLPDGEPFQELVEPRQLSDLETADGPRALRVALAPGPVDTRDPLLCHKTTHRQVYDEALAFARALRPDLDDVLLWNQRGEITEATRYNVLVERDGAWVTPPLSSGVLAGTYRARLLAAGRIREGAVERSDLAREPEVVLINSVRGARRAEVVATAVTIPARENREATRPVPASS